MTTLLDGNVLIALSFPEHVHARSADTWFANLNDSFATCPITQGSLLRYLIRQKADMLVAQAVLTRITNHPRHIFWPDSLTYLDVRAEGVIGHGQVTDAYLAQLARNNDGVLSTFDDGLAALHSDVAKLIPVLP